VVQQSPLQGVLKRETRGESGKRGQGLLEVVVREGKTENDSTRFGACFLEGWK